MRGEVDLVLAIVQIQPDRVNAPDASLVAPLTRLSMPRGTTVAPGRPAPSESTTRPVTVEVTAWWTTVPSWSTARHTVPPSSWYPVRR